MIMQIQQILLHVLSEELDVMYTKQLDILEAIMGIQSICVIGIAAMGIVVGLVIIYIITCRW